MCLCGRLPTSKSICPGPNNRSSVNLNELLAAFKDILERTSRRDLIEVEPDRLLVKDKISDILEMVRTQEWITFGSLFESDITRINVLTTFLALLETVKLQLVRVYQDQPFGTILISRRSLTDDQSDTNLDSRDPGIQSSV
jgi:segregation and condensation protein A